MFSDIGARELCQVCVVQHLAAGIRAQLCLSSAAPARPALAFVRALGLPGKESRLVNGK